MQNDDVANLTDSELIAAKEKLRNQWMQLQISLRNDPTNAKLAAQQNEIDARLDRIRSRIEFRLKAGAIV